MRPQAPGGVIFAFRPHMLELTLLGRKPERQILSKGVLKYMVRMFCVVRALYGKEKKIDSYDRSA